MMKKEFCESGKHIYHEVDVLVSLFALKDRVEEYHLLVACEKCDSQFLRKVDRPLP